MNTFDRIQKLIEENEEIGVPLMRKIGITPSLYSKWKRNIASPSTDAIIKIANYFNVSTDYLLTGKEKESLILSLDEKEILTSFKKLNKSAQEECIDFCNYLLSKKK